MSNTSCFGFQGNGGSGGGSTGYIDITYDVLYNTIIAGALVPGQKYRLTDYRSLNWLNGEGLANQNPTPIDPSFNPQEIYTSQPEVLLLEAISFTDISPIAYSEQYPQDIIEYLPIMNEFGLEGGVGIFNGATLPDSSIVTGFDLQWDGTNVYFDMPIGFPAYLGHDFYLSANFAGGFYYIDADYNPLLNGICPPSTSYSTFSTSIQWVNGGTRIILTDLGFHEFQDYEPNSLYVTTLLDFAGAYGKIIRRNDTTNYVDMPFDFRNQVFRRYEIDTGAVRLGIVYGGLGDQCSYAGVTYTTTGNYIDSNVFPSGASYVTCTGTADNNVFFGKVTGCNFIAMEGFTILKGIDTTNIDAVYDTLARSIIRGCRINYCSDNLINLLASSSFSSLQLNEMLGFNSIITSVGIFAQNKIQGFNNNIVGDSFQNNSIASNCAGNTFGTGFNNNTIAANFQQNIVGNNVFQNSIGANCTLNNFGDGFNNNINIKTGFIRNTICASFGFFDFNAATYVYANYDCQIISMQDGGSFTFWLAYSKYNGGAPLLQYDAPNA